MTAGLSAGGAEAAAPKLAQYLYGKDAKDLTADEKGTISAITGLVASGVGATTGDVASTVQGGQVAQNAVEDNLYAILTSDGKKYDGKKNTEYLEALRSCSHAQCVNKVLTNNAKDAMKNAPQVLVLNGTNYKEGQIIGDGLQYLVVNENGVLKAKLLPLNYQVINSIKELDSSRALAQGGALTAPLANLVKGLHDSTTGTSILTNEQLSMVDRAFAAMDAAGSFGMITGAFLPKGVKTTGSSKTIQENNIYRDGDLNNVLNGNPNAAADIAISQKKSIDSSSGLNNPHYDSKHGAYTTLEKQYERAMNGTNPQTGNKGQPVDASKFFNSTDMQTAIKKAEALYKQNPTAYGNGKIEIIFNRPIEEGFVGNSKTNIKNNAPIGEYRWSNKAIIGIDKATGKAYTAYPDIMSGIAKPNPLNRR